MGEAWLVVPGYPEYEASNLGRIRSRVTRGKGLAGRVLAPRRNRAGYATVTLCTGGRRDRMLQHRVVAMTWLGPPPSADATCIHHKNHVRADNRACNLMWCSHAVNSVMSAVEGRLSRTGMTATDIRRIRERRARGERGTDLAQEYGVTPANIWRIVNRRTWRHVA